MRLATLICGLVLAIGGPPAAAYDALNPAPLVTGQEEWPEEVGCPTGYVIDKRPKAQKQFRPNYTICVKGNIAKCVVGQQWEFKDGRSCLRCLCHQGNTADCSEMDECPTPKQRFPTHFHYNCRRKDKKVCPPGCTMRSREPRCVNCDCT